MNKISRHVLFELQNIPVLGSWRADRCYMHISMSEQALPLLSKCFCSLLDDALRFMQSLLMEGCSSKLFAQVKSSGILVRYSLFICS